MSTVDTAHLWRLMEIADDALIDAHSAMKEVASIDPYLESARDLLFSASRPLTQAMYEFDRYRVSQGERT